MNNQNSYIQTNGIQIHYERLDGDKIPFIFCHGITDNGRCMLRLAENLAPRFDVILVDADVARKYATIYLSLLFLG